MASTLFHFSFLLFSLLTSAALIETTSDHHRDRLHNIAMALSDAGYTAMSLTLEMTLPMLVSSSQEALTIFCPSDAAFFSLKYLQPPFTLLQYHVVPIKLEREALESSLPLGFKIDTLLHGHPLVLTTIPHYVLGNASINDVKITQWDIYNDGRIIVHGVENFFDPAYQTILYPWYNINMTNNNNNNNSNSNSNDIQSRESSSKGITEILGELSGVVLLFMLVGWIMCYLVIRDAFWLYVIRDRYVTWDIATAI